MAKRGADDLTQVGVKKIKAADGTEVNVEDLMEIRMLVDNTEASVIIGKAGANVKSVRTESGAFVSILKTESQTSKERVMTVKGELEAIAKAIKLMAGLLVANQQTKIDPATEAGQQYAVKILIHKFLAGAIIGKAGAIIREIQDQTKVRMSLSVDALTNSTEKTVSLTGTPECIEAGALRVLNQLATNPLRAGCSSVPYVPGGFSPAGYGAPPAAVGYGAPPAGYSPFAPPAGQQAAYGAAPVQGYGAPPPQQGYGAPYGAAPSQNPYAPQYGAAPGAPGAVEKKTEKIVIPSVCAGFVIGKSGATIRDIKNQSGTFISIADPAPTTPADRVVSVTGTSQGIQTAIYLIRQRVESYQPPPQQQ